MSYLECLTIKSSGFNDIQHKVSDIATPFSIFVYTYQERNICKTCCLFNKKKWISYD